VNEIKRMGIKLQEKELVKDLGAVGRFFLLTVGRTGWKI